MIPAKYWSPTKRLMLLGAMAGGKAVEDTATGNPLTFLTDLSKPLKSLVANFLPIQDGTDDPSPSNIRPIVPWDGLTVWNGGKNLLDPSKQDNSYPNNIYFYKDDGLFLPAGTYTMSKTGENASMFVSKKSDGSHIANGTNKKSFTFTLANSETVIINYYKSGGINHEADCQLEVGQTATAYEPYKPITETEISLPSPVYGGTLDAVSGVLTVEWVMASFKRTVFGAVQEGALDYRQYTDLTLPVAKTDGSSWYNARREQKSNICVIANPYSETSFGNLIGVVFSIAAFQKKPTFRISDALYQSLTDTDDIKFVYELATPQEIQLTPQQITALKGNNTLWSDANGDMIAVYFKKA